MPRIHQRPFLAFTLLLALILGVISSSPTRLWAQDAPLAEPVEQKRYLSDTFNDSITRVNDFFWATLMADISFGAFKKEVVDEATGEITKVGSELPLLVMMLLFGGVYFTIFHRFINIRGFLHAINITRGKYDHPEHMGEVSHFRALTSALSATVGLGNIAGVAIAIHLGGPGAVFWMFLAAIFGMASKFNECTLAQMYRKTNLDGTISGGPMYYLDIGLREKGGAWRHIGKVLAVLFAFMIMGGAIGGGNMFQANQSFAVVSFVFDLDGKFTSWGIDPRYSSYIYGIVVAALVALVILGGIKRIGAATSRIVPLMAAVYVIGCLVVIITHITKIPAAFMTIFEGAFAPDSVYGGFIGVLVMGLRRAAFSNEAGIGSSAIAHAAARTDKPVREGLVAMMEPFVDTVVICTMTALVVIVTGTYLEDVPTVAANVQPGAILTVHSFQQVIGWFPYILAASVVLFAYSTMISWGYYGERGWIYLLDHFGEGVGIRTLWVFRWGFVLMVFVGSVMNLGPLLDFSDTLLLSAAFPNIIGGIILAPLVYKHLSGYWEKYKAGEYPPGN